MTRKLLEMFWRVSDTLTAMIFIILLACGTAAHGQDEEILTNETVLELHNMGFSEQIIIGKIQNSLSDFKTDLQSLKALKEAGIPDDVVAAMIEAGSSGNSIDSEYDPNDPLQRHSPGIYFFDESEPDSSLVKIEPSVYTQSKSGGYFKTAMTYGVAKVKSKAVLAGGSAQTRVTGSRPEFYFYFEETESGLSYQEATTSPAEFVLAQFTVRKKKGKETRELVVGQFNYYGSQSGALDKTVRLFDFEKVGPGIYKVSPQEPLASGEYGFYYAGATPLPVYGVYGVAAGGGGGGKVFDFSVAR